MFLPRAVFQGAWVSGVAALLALGCGSDDDGDDGLSAAGAGSSSVGGSASAVGGTSNGGSSGGGASGSAGGGRAGGSASGGTAGSLGDSCTTASPISCVDSSTVRLCSAGTFENVTCDEVCTWLGTEAGPCVSDPVQGADCACGSLNNEACLRGVAAFCTCAEGTTSPCTDEQRLDLYFACVAEDPRFAAIACYGDYINDVEGTVDCTAALACFGDDETGEGGAGGSG